ncbi:hypothetical protein ACFPOB_07085 [Bosea eneae]|uniref:Uncharacterized protein n=1 Tax=Bosea eneae TaxID=151454 RepID=A0ABW0IM14_9HYPH
MARGNGFSTTANGRRIATSSSCSPDRSASAIRSPPGWPIRSSTIRITGKRSIVTGANASPALSDEPDGASTIYTAALRAYVSGPASQPQATDQDETIMRPEIQTQLDNAKQSIGLLRRHL